MNNKYKISVMIITFNRKKELLRAMESCVKCRMPQMEIVVLDNHSEDGSWEAVENYLRKCDMPFKYHYLQENLGIAEGRNVAFGLCSGEIVFCLDDDAVIETEDFFCRLYEKMVSDKETVAAAVEIFEPANNRFLKGYVYKKAGVEIALSYIGAAHALKRDYFEGRKLYPSTLRFGSEEYYVAYRIRNDGKNLLYLNDLRVLHMPSKIARVTGRERDIDIIINNYLIRKMCYPVVTLPILTVIFYARFFAHRFLKYASYKEIKKKMSTRYDKQYVDRISVNAWLKMVRDTELSQIF